MSLSWCPVFDTGPASNHATGTDRDYRVQGEVGIQPCWEAGLPVMVQTRALSTEIISQAPCESPFGSSIVIYPIGVKYVNVTTVC